MMSGSANRLYLPGPALSGPPDFHAAVLARRCDRAPVAGGVSTRASGDIFPRDATSGTRRRARAARNETALRSSNARHLKTHAPGHLH